jgi:SAM-dependent methyltransferase
MKRDRFQGMDNDYRSRVEVLKAIDAGPLIYEFGASWGYGSYILSQAGFTVYSHEISTLRAEYGARKLGCNILPDPLAVPEKVDCFFSSHVIEHLPDPAVLWRTANAVLKPRGKVVIYTPNGEPSRERQEPDRYHLLWGKVHPLLLSAKALKWQARQFGYEGECFTSPYELQSLTARRAGMPLTGPELLFIGS